MASGGEFEQLNTKASVVFIYALWEDGIRAKVADLLGVDKSDVRCALMGDLGLIRNVIIHQSKKAKRDYKLKASFLPQIWEIDPDDVIITSSMLQTLFEQLNAIQVNIHET